MTTISIRLDDELKQELDEMCDQMGMSLTTFFTIYAKRALHDRKIPFEVTAPAESAYTKRNESRIRHSLAQARNGQIIHKSLAELEAMADE